MRLQLLSCLGLGLRTAMASMDNMFELITQLEELSYNKSVEAGTATEEDRGFVGLISSRLGDLDHYGCWCYFDEDFALAKGPVQDGLDAECKKLVNGYECIIQDAIARSEACDVLTQNYETYNLFGANPDVVVDCNTNSNTNLPAAEKQCGIDLCVVEGTFTLTLFALLLQIGGISNTAAYDANLAHPDNALNGPFDPATECATNTLNGAGRSEKECCGVFPNRFPFKTFNGDRACCGQRTFNTQTLQCCPDVTESPTDPLLDTVQDKFNSCPVVSS